MSRARNLLAASLLAPLLAVASPPAAAFEADTPPALGPAAPGAPMTLERLDALIRRVDAGAKREGPGWQLTVDGTEVQVVADASHDRMRIVMPVAEVAQVSEAMMRRCLQANFASALDARYGIAQGLLWSTFLHPLGSLDERLFLSGLGQTLTLARTYGTTFQSGELTFGGGDAPEAGEGPDPAGGAGARESEL